MCSIMYLTALVWLWCLPYKQECLTARLMQLLALALHSGATLHRHMPGLVGAARGVNIWTYPCSVDTSEGLMKTEIENKNKL